MPSIDERVVSMAFENRVFEQRVAQTIATLGKLDSAIKKLSGAGLQDIEKSANKVTLQQPMAAVNKLNHQFAKTGAGASAGMIDIEKAGHKVQLEQPVKALQKVQSAVGNVSRDASGQFTAIQAASDRVHFQGMSSAIDHLGGKFTVLKGTAATALGNIAAQATQKGGQILKSLSLGPILQGFEEYGTNMQSIQTIMANTEGQKVSGLEATNEHLNELNHYADQTKYNFADMAKNIGTFTAAGVDLPKATASIKGIANLAALSGSSSQQASEAMRQLSQAIASGKVGLQDWNSVVAAGMGGAKFQQSLIRTGVAMGTIDEAAVKIDKSTGKATINGQSFRDSIRSVPGQESWLTDQVLTGSLEQFTGDLSDAELKAKGFTEEQIKQIQMTAKSAKKAATEAKTVHDVMDQVKEAIGSGWAKTFQHIFGDFEQSKKLFTGLAKTISDFVGHNAEARNKVLGEWNKEGGRAALIEGLKNAFKALFAILKPIGQAFRDIFPRKTAADLIETTKRFRDFTAGLKPSAQTVENIRKTFRGLFAVLSIGWYVVKKVAGVLFDLLGIAGKSGGGILKFTGSVGDLLTSLKKAIVDGDALGGVFQTITNVLRLPLELLKGLAKAFFSLFDGMDAKKAEGASHAFDGVSASLKPFKKIVDGVRGAWKKLGDILGSIKDALAPIIQKIAETFGDIAGPIADAIKNADFDKVMTALNTTLFAGLVLTIKKAFGKGILSGNTFNTTIGNFKEINKVFGALTGNLKALQQNIQANTLLQIAIAIGILAAGVAVLSQIDPKALARAMGAVAVGMGQLVAALALLSIVVSKGGVGSLSLAGVAGSLILLAGATVILAGALKIFATMSWEEIARGFTAMAGSLGAVVLALRFIDPAGMIRIGLGLMAIAGALVILGIAMKIMSGMSWEEMGKGLTGIAGSLGILIGAMRFMDPSGMIRIGLGIGAIAFGLTLMSGAISSFGSMDLETMAKGMGAIGVALVGLGLAVDKIPPGMAAKAGALILMAIALNGVASAVKTMGALDPDAIIKGLAGIGGALTILVLGLNNMAGTVAGSAALLLAAGALAILAPTLAFLGTLKWETLGKGLLGLVGIFVVLGVAGLLGAEAIGALAIALLPFGLAMLAAGVGVYFLAKALGILGEQGTKGIALMLTALTAFIALIPTIAVKFAQGIVQTIAEIAKLAPSIVESLVKIVESLVEVIVRLAPRWAVAVGSMVDALVLIVIQNAPKLIKAGYALLLGLLRGLDDNISQITTRVASIVSKFLNGMANRMPLLAAAGARFLLSILDGIAQHIGDLVAAGGRIVVKLANAVFPIIRKVGSFGPRAIASFIRGLTDGLDDLVRAGARLIINTLDGVSSKFKNIAAAATRFVVRFFNALGDRENTRKMVSAGINCAINILRGIADGIREKDNLKRVVDAAVDVGKAIAGGILKGLAGLPKRAFDKAISPLKWGLGAVKKVSGSNSPSKVTDQIGKDMVKGMDNGLSHRGGFTKVLKDNMINPVRAAVKGAKKILKSKSPSQVFVDIGQNMVDGLTIGLRGTPGALEKGVTQPIAAMLAKTKGLREFKKFLSSEFKTGLFGGLFETDNRSDAQKQIDGAFDALKLKLTENHKALSEQIKQQKADLKDLEGDTGRDNYRADGSDLNARRRALAEEERILALSQFRSRSLMAQLEDEKTALNDLAVEYEATSKLLEKAKEIFNEYKQQYSTLPEISGIVDEAIQKMKDADDLAAMSGADRWKAIREKQKEEARKQNVDQVALYKERLAEQIKATQVYMETLKKLRAAGLDDVTYEKLLKQGVAGQDFASQLLSKGKAGIEELNKMNAELAASAATMADNAATELYKAGEQAAIGLIAGLEKHQEEIRQTMEFIAASMIKSLKFRLGIRSPSRIFAEMGQYSVQGLIDGLTSSTAAVKNAATNLGTETSTALSSALSDIQNGIDSDLTITPVLDLSQVEKDAGRIQDLANVTPITAAASFGQAAAISDAQKAATAEADSGATVFEVNFEQNNTSPKALDDVELYRLTRNELSKVKSALGLIKNP